MPNEILLMSFTTAANRLEMSASGLKSLLDRGELPTLRDTNGRRCFFASDVENLRARRAQAKAKANGSRPKLRSKRQGR